MNPTVTASFLQIISAAVTPIVMVSACASLILGINNKHNSIADRVRNAVMECRQETTTDLRRVQLLRQVAVFHQRFLYTWVALVVLFSAVGVFLMTALLIVIENGRHINSSLPTLVLFFLGVILMMTAAVCEVIEVALASRSLRIEMQDVVPESQRRLSFRFPTSRPPKP